MGDIELRKKQKEFLDWMKKTAEEDSTRNREIYQSFRVDFRCSKTKKDWAVLLRKDDNNNLFEILRIVTPNVSSSQSKVTKSSLPKSTTVDLDQIKNHRTVKCPYCGDVGWIKCGCGKLSCQGGVSERNGREWHVCPWCGEEGFIEGTFQTINGEMEDKERISRPKDKLSLPSHYKALPS